MDGPILLIDDDADDQLLFREMISEIGTRSECMTADNGLEGLLMLSAIEPPPALIFLDLNMPLVNGWECLQQIKGDEKNMGIPVIILTTSDNQADKQKALQQGAKMYLTKTADIPSLKKSIREILRDEGLLQ